MGGDGKIDGKIVIQRNQGISQAIRDELNLTQEQCNSLGKSVWTKIFEQVDEQQKKGDIYEGSNDAFSDSPPNYVVHENQKIEFSADIWENIVKLVNDKLGTTIKTGDNYEVGDVDDETPANRGGEVKAEDIKVKVPQVYINLIAKSIYNHHQEGAALKEKLRKGDIRGITPETVSTAFDSTIKFGPNSRKQAKVVFEALVEGLERCGLDIKINTWKNFSQLPIQQQNKILYKYRNQLLARENETIRNFNNEKVYHNKNIKKIQNAFDKANELLVEVANKKKKTTIIKGNIDEANPKNWKLAKLSDGRWIQVEYDENKEIECISISYDTTHDRYHYYSEGNCTEKEDDCAEISYDKCQAHYDIDKSIQDNSSTFSSGYDFEKLKAVAEKIFGKWNG